jgi:hypothetical protein
MLNIILALLRFFCSRDRSPSPFLKGVLWAIQAAKMGYNWNVGDGKKVRFWEDQWFGSFSLSIQYWEIYSIINEQGCSVREAWDGLNLRFTFRRTVNRRLMNQWFELIHIACSISFIDEPDSIIWQFISTVRYSVQSLCCDE